MSDGSLLPVQQPARPLRAHERDLVQALALGVYSRSEIEHRLAHAVVREMSDGGMGSIRFASPTSVNPRFGREASVAEYIDEDGVLVSITLNLDQDDNLFEIDLWKADFSPLVRYPAPQDLKLHEVAAHPTRSAVAS